MKLKLSISVDDGPSNGFGNRAKNKHKFLCQPWRPFKQWPPEPCVSM